MKFASVGSGMIVHRFLAAAKIVEGVSCEAVYSRTYEKGKALADEFGIPKIYDDYEAMLSDKAIDTIYIASPNSLHFIQSKKALEAGKNVICEKPFTSTLKECEELVALAKKHKLFLWEAITTLYLPNYQIIKDNLPRLGNVKMVVMNFSQFSSKYPAYLNGEVPNVFNPVYSGGALMDINVYNIHFVTGLFGMPFNYHYSPNIGPNGIDTSGVIELDYRTFKAVCIGAKDCSCENIFTIQGDKGSIKVFGSSSGVCKNVEFVGLKGDTIGLKNSEPKTENLGIEQVAHMSYEIASFQQTLNTKDYDTCYARLEHTTQVVELMENARKDAGIHFEADNHD